MDTSMIYIRFTMGLACPRDLWIVLRYIFVRGVKRETSASPGTGSLSKVMIAVCFFCACVKWFQVVTRSWCITCCLIKCETFSIRRFSRVNYGSTIVICRHFLFWLLKLVQEFEINPTFWFPFCLI